jgi:hypothetical protein
MGTHDAAQCQATWICHLCMGCCLLLFNARVQAHAPSGGSAYGRTHADAHRELPYDMAPAQKQRVGARAITPSCAETDAHMTIKPEHAHAHSQVRARTRGLGDASCTDTQARTHKHAHTCTRTRTRTQAHTHTHRRALAGVHACILALRTAPPGSEWHQACWQGKSAN